MMRSLKTGLYQPRFPLGRLGCYPVIPLRCPVCRSLAGPSRRPFGLISILLFSAALVVSDFLRINLKGSSIRRRPQPHRAQLTLTAQEYPVRSKNGAVQAKTVGKLSL